MSTGYANGTPEQREQAAAVTAVIARQMGRRHRRAIVSHYRVGDFWEIGYSWQRQGSGVDGTTYDVTLARGDTFEQALDKARKKIKPES
jgi:hypothetical protein